VTSENAITSSPLPARFRRIRNLAGLAGTCALVACAATWIILVAWHPQDAAAFYKGYLFAWLFFLAMSLGAMTAVMVDHLVGGEWGAFVRRFGEAAANVLPLMFVLFVPILIGLRRIYPWADPNNHNAVVVHKQGYLNPGLFIARYVVYFAIWITTAWLLRRFSLQRDRAPGPRAEHSLRVVSAAGLVAYFVTMSLAAVDWIMSLEPQWYSTIFGLIVCVGQAVVGLAMLIIMLDLMSTEPPFATRVQPRHFNDLATLLITAVILWAYHAFSQLLVTWMGNVQGEITWYVKRSFGPWRVMAGLLMFMGFLAPFLLLLQRGIKKRGKMMRWICCGLLVMQLLNIYWMIAPSGNEPYPELDWLNGLTSVVALVGIGGPWIAAFLWLLDGPPLMPLVDRVPIDPLSNPPRVGGVGLVPSPGTPGEG
jgi:hypothetical protein